MHIETITSVEDWYFENRDRFQHYGIKCTINITNTALEQSKLKVTMSNRALYIDIRLSESGCITAECFGLSKNCMLFSLTDFIGTREELPQFLSKVVDKALEGNHLQH
jgi:hypothetical protein